MSNTEALLDALKDLLKRSGLTYADAATALDLSEASVKRLFSEQSFTLKRIETLCQLAGAELMDLVRSADDGREKISELTHDQEREIVENVPLLISAICVMNRLRFDEILRSYDLDQHELQRNFVRLDRLGIIELLPENRYRLTLSRGFRWRRSGPIQRFFSQSIIRSFLNKQLVRDADHFRFAWGTVTPTTAEHFLARLKQVFDEFNEAADRDSQMPLSERTGSALLLAFRHNWEPEEFTQHKIAGGSGTTDG